MTLDEAIKRFETLAESYESYVESINPKELAKCLKELKELREQISEYKWLLKAAVEDNKRVLRENFGDICQFCKHYSNSEAQCRKPHNGSGSWCCENAEWRYADEALKLIGGSENG